MKDVHSQGDLVHKPWEATVYDPARLDALRQYDIMDTGPEAAFERIAHLAARMFEVPVALLGFIDDERHWFKACHGMVVTEVPNRASFCVHALDEDEVLVVPDATRDPRFSDNPIVTGHEHIRFYAGAPVRSPDGQSVGSLCIMDTRPRPALTPDQAASLADLAGIVASELELRRSTQRAIAAEASRRESEAHYRALIHNASDIITLLDAEGKVQYQSPAFASILGHDPSAAVGTSVLDWIHAEDRKAFQVDFARSLTQGETVHTVYRAQTAGGESRWLESAIASALDDPAVENVVMHTRDVTRRETISRELDATSRRLTSIMDSISDAFMMIDDDWNLTDFNDRAATMLGRDRGDVLGENVWKVFPKAIDTRFQAACKRAVETSRPATFETYYAPDDAWFEVWAYPGAAGLAVYFRDVSERKAAHEALVRSKQDAESVSAQLAASVAQLERRTDELVTLSEMGEVLQACHTVEEAFSVCGEFLRELFPEKIGAVYLTSASGNLLEAVAEWGGLPEAAESKVFAPDRCWGLRRGRHHVVEGSGSRMGCRHVEPDFAGSYLCVPLLAQGQASGILHLRRPNVDGTSFDPAKQRLAIAVAEQVGLAIANIRLREKLRNQSIRDPLTGLFNRRYLEESLERELHRAARAGQPMSVIMLDVDHFKSFNDTFGHEAGDLVLREVGTLLRQHTRTEDIACRYGGEEFILAMPGASSRDAERRAETLRAAVKDVAVEYRGASLAKVGLSLGVAEFPTHADNVDALVRSADAALYQAKAKGRDRVVVAESTRS